MWLPILGLIVGITLGWLSPLALPTTAARYLSVAVLAALDSIFGGVRAGLENNFDNKVFLSGFFSNAILAAGLAYIGERLGVELYTAAVFAFGVRLFQNLAIIRRHILKA